MNEYQEALDFAKQHLDSKHDLEKIELLQELVDKETLLKPQKEYEWIPVTERLPDKAGTYLVTYHPRYGDNVDENVVAIDVDNFGRGLWGNRKRQRVIAWMPLPEPYKGSE